MEEVVELLHKINDSVTKQSDSFYFTISYDSMYESDKNTAKYTHYFDKPIPLESDKYEIGLLGLDTYYSIPNITSSRNGNFRYSVDNQLNWKVVTIPTGSYEVKTIADIIVDLQGVDSRNFSITPDIAT